MTLFGVYYIGKVSIKRHPSIYWASSARLPPILSIMRRLRASPNPVPFENVSNLANRSNTNSCLSWGMPMPVSVMQIMICITDTGIGIPQDKQEFVFERFAKLDTFSKGTGLGLALSRLIMERMGGNLALDAQYMDGCRFILTLPI